MNMSADINYVSRVDHRHSLNMESVAAFNLVQVLLSLILLAHLLPAVPIPFIELREAYFQFVAKLFVDNLLPGDRVLPKVLFEELNLVKGELPTTFFVLLRVFIFYFFTITGRCL
jgi:hypothetical protein